MTICGAARPSWARPLAGRSANGRTACSSSCARQGQGKRATARYLAFGVNGLGLLVMIVVFAHTGGLGGGEVGRGRRCRRAQPEDPRGGARRPGGALPGRDGTRATCTARVADLLDGERRRFLDRLDAVGVHEDAGAALRAAVQDVEDAR